MRRATVLLFLPLLMSACKKEKPLAPTEMTDIVRYMFDNFEDPEALGAAIDNLDPWMQENATSEEAIDGYRLDPLTEDDVKTITPPSGAQVADLLGAAGGNASAFDLDAQADHIVLKDQVAFNSKYDQYDRRFVGGTTASGFRAGDPLRTINEVMTTSFGVTIPYTLYKDYRWVESENGILSIVARSWIEKKGCNEAGNNCLLQSYSIDHFHGDGSETLRLTATWSQVETIITLGDDLLIDGLADGLQDTFESTEAYLSEQ